ncbi:MAG: hypothetical protein U0768_14380 [Anaerolineae bacterium]
MTASAHIIDVYLEIGKKRVFACALDWPGWARIGRDENSALAALLDYAGRYGRALHVAHIPFDAPTSVSHLTVVERLEGNATTDFGAPDIAPSSDTRPIDEAERTRLQALLQAYWGAFDAAADAAVSKELRKGPRGGGRDVEGITRHVMGAEGGYLNRLAWKLKTHDTIPLSAQVAQTRQAVLDALAHAVRDGLPERGPRGGAIWSPRYFVRRVGWHTLDHAWEIEDRTE